MKIKYEITKDQCYCSFGDGIVYEFVPTVCFPHLYDCLLCALAPETYSSEHRIICLSVPCQKRLRKDKKSGYWRISKNVDYQAFTKMLKNGG